MDVGRQLGAGVGSVAVREALRICARQVSSRVLPDSNRGFSRSCRAPSKWGPRRATGACAGLLHRRILGPPVVAWL
eukprot:6328089-Pyramimonas_sp.AAC.2